MQKEKGISTLTGIIIIVVAALVLFGGVFAYQYFATLKANNQQQKTTACTSKWICSWGPCVNGSQQQSGYDSNNCDGGYGGSPIQKQTAGCSPIVRTCTLSIPASITVNSPKGGDVWQIGNMQTIEYSSSVNFLNIDAFLIDSNGKETALSMGNYFDKGGGGVITFELGSAIQSGIYKVEVKTSSCGEGFCPYSGWGIGNGYITIISAAQDQTAGWKTYKNINLGFQFNYPDGFGVLQEYSSSDTQECKQVEAPKRAATASVVILLAAKDNLVINMVCDNLTQAEINSYNNPPYWTDSVKEITVAGKKSYQHEYTTSTGYTYRIVQIPLDDNHFIEINYNYGNSDRLNKTGYELSATEWGNMLSTFKFIK